MSSPTAAKQAIRDQVLAQFKIALGNRPYTQTPNSILEARYQNTTLTAEERCDALLERTSFGNFSLFACTRNWDTGVATPLGQSDFVKLLGLNKQRISDAVSLRNRQGCYKPDGRLLQFDLDPTIPEAKPKKKETKPDAEWKAFSERWDKAHAQEVARRNELLAALAPLQAELDTIEKAKLGDFKKGRKAAEKKSATSRTSVPDSPDKMSATPPTPPVAHTYRNAREEEPRTVLTETAPVVVNLTHKSTEQKRVVDFQKPTTTKPPEPQPPQKYATDRDELIAVIERHTGRRPDVKLMRDITETLELRQWTLRQYLDDIIPRIGRLKRPPGEGFFLSHAQKVGGVTTEPAPEPQPLEEKSENGRCKKCNGVGQVNGFYCTCKLGVELERYAVKDDPQKAAIPNGKAHTPEHHGIHNGVTAKGPG